VKSEASDEVLRQEVGGVDSSASKQADCQEVKMSKVKAGGSSKNNRDSAGRRLGVKLFGGEPVKNGQIIIRQVGSNKRPGVGTFMSKDFTIHAAKDGIVQFNKRRFKLFSGKTAPRTEVTVK
jgi:large subunit ribosomal protein L27